MELNLNDTLKEAALKIVADNEEGFFGMRSERTTMIVCKVMVDDIPYEVHLTATLDESDFMQSGNAPTIDFNTEEVIPS